MLLSSMQSVGFQCFFVFPCLLRTSLQHWETAQTIAAIYSINVVRGLSSAGQFAGCGTAVAADWPQKTSVSHCANVLEIISYVLYKTY
jgi:uncharacterized membrane protein